MTDDNVFCFRAMGDELVPIERKISETAENHKLIETKQLDSNTFAFQQDCYHDFDVFLHSFEQVLYTMNLTQKEINEVYSICKNLLKRTEILCGTLMDSMLPKAALSHGVDFIHKRLCQRDSTFKRERILSMRKEHTAPTEKPIGLKWKTTSHPRNTIPDHKLIQATFPYIAISDSIKEMFLSASFKQIYYEHNLQKCHQCTDGIYRDFCCSITFKKHQIFESPLTLQIQIGMDDFDPNDALKAKAGNQKMCGIYFEIRNLPPEFSSKLDLKKLVAIVKVSDIKENNDGLDSVIRHIVSDLKFLGNEGIYVEQDNIKGALINICGDNLGANSVFGFVESFNAHYFCRICECDKIECKSSVVENPEKLRNKIKYEECFSKYFNGDQQPNFKDTKGLKKYCLFNDLDSFHIFENLTVDVMHDLLEGVVPFFIELLIDSLRKSTDLTISHIRAMIRDFNYGSLSKKYCPSTFRHDRTNFGLSAKQLHCLILNLPFIFINYKDSLAVEWNAMEELLQIIRIVFSHCITEHELSIVNNSVQSHLKFVIDCGRNLIPKHHMMTHYATVIRSVGSIIKTWMMRYESKHKVFTDMAHRTQNFVDLPKTLARKHQMIQSYKSNVFVNEIKSSKTKTRISSEKNYEKYKQHLETIHFDDLTGYKFFIINSNEYRPGLIIFENQKPFEIIYLFIRNENFILYCHPYNIVGFQKSLNSIKVVKENNFSRCRIINLNDLNTIKSYNKIICNGETYIIADSTDVHSIDVQHNY